MIVIKTDNLVKVYRNEKQPAVAGVTLQIEKGEFIGLLGPNGAGKSTLISMISGLFPPSSGRIEIDGHQVGSRNHKKLIGLVPQEIALYTSLTLAQNLTYFGRMYGLKGIELQQRADFCMEMANLSDFATDKIASFSSGMQRRANLVIGLIHEPKILILDEPTVGIDAQSRHAIFESLKKINHEGTTLLYATHYMEEAEQLCSRVIIIDQGHVLTEGTVDELIAANQPCENLEELFLKLTGHQLKDTV